MSGGPWKEDSDSSTYRYRVLRSLKTSVEVYSVGVGPDTPASQMRPISSGRRYWFLSNSYDDLQYVRPRLIRSIQGGKYPSVQGLLSYFSVVALKCLNGRKRPVHKLYQCSSLLNL